MDTYVFGVFETQQSDEPIEIVVLGINCTVTAHSLLDALLGIRMPRSGSVRLIQTVDFAIATCWDWNQFIGHLCVPYFIAMKDSWPRDEWYVLTPDIHLQLVSTLDSANNEVASAYIYPVDRKTGISNFNRCILVWTDTHKYIDDFIKGDY